MLDTLDDDNLWREDLFKTLGVTPQTTKDEIRQAYKQLAKKYHPDRYPANTKEQDQAKEIFSKISKAYDVLTNDAKRAQYLDTRRLLADHLQSEERVKSPVATPPKKSSDEVLQIKKKQADEFFQQAQRLSKRNQLDDAISALKQAIELSPESAMYHSNLGQAYQNKGWTGMAQASYRQALLLNPRDPLAKQNFVEEKPKKTGLLGMLGFGKKK